MLMLETAIRFIIKTELIEVQEELKKLKKHVKELRNNKKDS